MKYDTEDYSSDYSSFKYGSSYGGSDSLDSEPIEPVEIDYGSALGIVKSDLWRKATPAQRGKTVDLAFTRLIESTEKNPDRKVAWTNRQGEVKDIPLLNPDKSWTATGKEWLQQQRSYLAAAAEDESGGVEWDRFDQEFVAPQHLSQILDRQKQFDPLSDLQNWMAEKNAVATENKTGSLVWEDFVSYANSDVKSDEAKIDPENKELRNEWINRMQREVYTPENLGEDVMMQKVGGQWVLNSMNYSEIDKMENAINSNEELSLADKKILLSDYRAEVEKHAGKIVNAFAPADAPKQLRTPAKLFLTGGLVGQTFAGAYYRPLNDEFQEAMSKPGASGYEFIKANKERFSKENYGVGQEVLETFRDAVISTGTGALWLASGGNYTSPAEAWGGLAEDTAKAYSNTTQFSAFGIDVNRRDLTQLTGQVGSFLATGGMGALVGKGLVKVGAVGASRYAVGEGGKLVLKSATAKATSVAAAKDVLKAGGNLPKVSIPAKMGGWLKDAATDPELYIGSLQAAGMGFGSAFNEAYERTGSRDEALKAANIEGISGGIAVMIATGVMNRVAPGMGKFLGTGDEGVGTSLIQNLRNRVVQKEGMKATQKSLEHLAGDAGAGLRKQFAKDIAQEMNDAARKMGLKGIGVAGNIGAEAVEESADAIISDVLSTMLDQSKTWNEDVWGNIGTKWKEYVKAGVLGAIGGGMGASLGTVTNAPQVFGKSDALNAMSDTWKAIETNIGNLGDNSLKMDVGGKAMSVSEMLSTELDSNQQIDVEKKSAMLVRAARGIGVYQAMPSSLVPAATQAAPADTSGTSSLDATQAPPEGSQRAYPQGSLGQVMQSVGEEAPAGREWSRNSKAVEGSETIYKNKTGNFTLTPIHAVNDVSGKRNDNVAFKMVPFTSRLGKKTEGKPEYLTPAQAQNKLKEIGKNKEAAQLDRIVNATPEEKAQQYDEWTNETSEQSPPDNRNNKQEPAPRETPPRDSSQAKGDGYSGPSVDGPSVTPQRDDSGASTSTTLIPAAQKLIDDKVSEERLIELASWKKEPGSLDPSNEQKTLNQIAAKAVLKSQGKWDDDSNSPLVKAKTETPVPAPKEKSQVSKFDRNESFESQLERTKDLKEGDEVAVLIDAKESIVKATIVETPKNGENGGYRSKQIAVRVIDSSGKVSEVKSSVPRWAVRKISKEPASTTAAVVPRVGDAKNENPDPSIDVSPEILEIRKSVRKALLDSGFKFSDDFDALQIENVARVVSKMLRGESDYSPEFINDSAEALSYLVYEQLSLPERDSKGREKIKDAIAEWMTTGKPPAKMEKSLWQKIEAIIKSIISKWTGVEIKALEVLLSQDLNEIRSGNKNFNLKPSKGKTLMSFQGIIDKNPAVANVLSFLQKNGIDFIITGSLAYSDQVSIYRDKSKLIHDLDLILQGVDSDSVQTSLKNEYNTSTLYDFVPRAGQSSRIHSVVVVPKGQRVTNIKKGWVKTKKGFEPTRSYDVIDTITGKKVGFYKFTPTEEISENAGVILDLIEMKAGVTRQYVKQGFKDASGKAHNVKVSDYVSGFVAKLNALRYKDLRDFRLIQPNADLAQTKPEASVPAPTEVAPRPIGEPLFGKWDGDYKSYSAARDAWAKENPELAEATRKWDKEHAKTHWRDGSKKPDNVEPRPKEEGAPKWMEAKEAGKTYIEFLAEKEEWDKQNPKIAKAVKEWNSKYGKEFWEDGTPRQNFEPEIPPPLPASSDLLAQTKPEISAPVTTEAAPTVDPLEAFITGLEQEDAKPDAEENLATSSNSAEGETFEYSQEEELREEIGLPPTSDNAPTEDAVTPQEAEKIVDIVLNDDEKAEAAELLGEKKWSPSTKAKFVTSMADWVAAGSKIKDRLSRLFQKVWKAMRAAGLIGGAIFSTQFGNLTRPQQVEIRIQNPSAIAQKMTRIIEPSSSVFIQISSESPNYISNGKKVLKSTISDDTSVGDTPDGLAPEMSSLAPLPSGTESMSIVGRSAYQQLYFHLKDELLMTDNLLIVADKPSGQVFVFNPDGSLLLRSKSLFGLTAGDDAKGGDSKSSRITPAGLFNLGLRDASRGGGEARTAGEYDFGKVFVLDKAIDGEYSATIFHSVWLNESDAAERLEALDDPSPKNSKFSFGCINLPKAIYKRLLDDHLSQMDGAKIFTVPDNTARLDEFLSGDTAQNKSKKDYLTRLSIPKPVQKKALAKNGVNEAGLDPVSAFLLTLASFALNRKKAGKSKKDIQVELDALVAESRFSPEKKAAVLSKISDVLNQSFAATLAQTKETANPQRPKPNEKQTENKRDEAKGLQVEEDQAEEEVVETPKTPEQKIAERLERDGIAATPELIASEYAKTETGNPNNRISNTIKAIQKLSEEGHVPMRAASVADAPSITDGLDPDSTYIVEAATLDGGTDAAGAKWTRKSSENGKERYGYMPPKGMASTMGVGDTVVIAGNDKQVLMLKKVVDGELIFEALNIDFDAANQNALNEQLRKTSARYTRSILNRSIKSIVPMMSRFSDGSITLAEVETIFKDLLSVVAPRNNFKVVEESMEKGTFTFARPTEKGSKKQSVIVVNYENLKDELVQRYVNSDKANQFAQELLAYDAASFITSVLSEEGIHVVTYGTFTPRELLSYYDNFWDLNDAFRSEQETKGVAEGKIKDHPLFEELRKVASDRKITKNLDPNNDKGVTEQQRLEITGELMRKFVQMALSGTTTERQTQLSQMLQRAMILDESNAREKKGFVKYLKAIGHMVRRYAERMRTILWINTQRGMLPSNLQEPLNRLIEATKKSGLIVDVLNAHSDTIAERTKMEELYNKSLESELQIIARNNSFPMRQLRNFLAASNRINIDIAIVHDPETMEIGLHPTLRELLENQKGENKIDMKALDDQFDRLNGKGGYSEDQTPAMKKIRTGVFLKWQKLQLLRDALPAQFSDMDLWTGAMKPDREGITRIDREKLFTKLFEDMTGGVSHSEVIDGSEVIKQARLVSVQPRIVEARMAHQALENYAREELDGLNLSTFSGMRKLVEWSRAMKLNPRNIDLGRLNRGLLVGVDLETRDYIADQDSSLTPEDLSVKMENHLKLLLQRLPMWSDAMAASEEKNDFGNGLRGEAKALFDAYVAKEQAVIEEIQEIRKAHNERIQHIKSLSNTDLLPKTEQKEGSSDDYKSVIAFTRAVDDYNYALKTAKNRAIGEFGLRTVGFGTAIKVQAINPESENPNSYSSLPPVDTGVDDLLDVVQDVGYSNIFPYEHQNGYDNSNADAPYSYSSRFIYPQRQESAVGQTESDGLAIGLDPNSKWERPGDEGLTPAEREWNAGLERYRHTTESNFMASGRNAFTDFFVAENIGEIRNIEMIEAYAQTAGFSFEKTVNPDDDSVRYDSLLEAMPIFDHQKLNRLVGGLRRLKKGLRSDNNQDPTKVIADLFSYLEEMRQWSAKIRSLYQGSGFMPRIGRMQTLAGRSLPIFDQAFSNETDNGTLTNGLDLQIRRMHEALMLKVMEYVEVKNISMDKAYLKSADTLILNNGLPVLRAGVDKKKLTDLAENLLKVVGEGNQKVMFDRSLYEAVQSVNLVRKQTKAFMDRKWRRNVEKEGNRAVTDPAYIPEYEQLTKLRNGALSPRTLKNLSFAMKYFEKERDYQFSANFGFEMLADFDKLSFGEGYESYVYTEAKAYDVYLSNSEAALVTTKEDGTLTHPNVPEYSELKQDKDGRYFYKKQFQAPNYNEIVVSPQQAGFDDPRSRPFLTGEESPLLEGMNEVKSGGVSSQRETAQRRATSLQTARERNVALWSMLIGSNTTTGRSATAGRIFYFDLLQADEDGFVTVDEVLEDRRRMKTAPRYKRKQTLSRRVDGSPFETTDDTYIEEEFETMEEFSEDELSAMNETQLKNYFKVMRDKSLLERGLVGIFPNINPARKEFFDEIRNGFLEKYGSKNGYSFTSSERFLHDLASFKADFERDMIDRAIVKDKGVAAMALGTILEYVDVEVLAGDDAAVQFKNKTKNKPILTKGNNTFASPEEARNIWALAHSEVMKPGEKPANRPKSIREGKTQVVDVSKVAFLNSTVGPIIEQFLLTLDGNTIAVMPDENTAAKYQLSDTGIRIFEGSNGNPNVIYVPQASSMLDKRMVDEASMVIAHALSINARKNPSIVDMVNDLAGKVNAALDPIVRAESIEMEMSPVGKWRKKTVDISEAKEAIEANFQRILEGSPVEFTEKQQARIRELIKAQFIKSIELARELEVGELTADQIALFGGDATFATNVLLVGTILSNSKAKQFFDQAYFAIESFKPSSLPAMVGDSLINAVMDIARSGEVEHGGVDPDWIGESSVADRSDADRETIQTFEESEQDRADRIADANAKYQADVDGVEIDEEEQTRTDAIYSVTSGVSDKVKSEIVGMVRANGGEAYFTGKSAFYSDADIVLINGLNSMIASAMKAREGVQPLKPSRDAREMLKEPGYLRDEAEMKASELAQPVVAPVAWKDRAGKIYVGEARNLGRPSLPGNRTSLTQGFADRRISNMNANVLQLSPYIQKWIKLRAEESIRQSLEKTRIDAANNKSSLDYSQLKRFKTIDLEIEMSDEIIEELRSILPTGYMDQAEQEVRDEIARLEESINNITKAQAKKYQEYAGALFQGVSFPREEVTKEVSDMMGYPQRFAQRLADMLQENILFEEGKVDQVAKGMSSFVRRQFKNDPLFKAAFNQMATLLDTINRELSVRHVFQEQNEDTVLIESGANPFRTLISSEENETRIGDLIRSYNSNVDVVNLVLDSMAKQGMALIGVDGSTKGYRLPYILGNPESISPQDLISLRRRSFGVDSTAKFKGQLMQHAERTIAAAFSDSIAKELAGAEGKTKMKSIPVGKDTRRNAQVKNFIKIVRQRMEEGRDLDNFDLASEITTALDMMTERLKSDPNGKNFSEYIKSIYLSFAEEDALYDRSLVTDDPLYTNKGQTAEQRDLVNKLEIQLDVISRGLAANQAALDLIDHADYKQSIGKTYHRGVVGVPAVGQGDKQVLAGIEPMTREAGVNITLVAKGLGLTESGMAARQSWTGDQLSMDEASSAALKAQRRAFYAQKEAVVRALSEFAEERLEDVYRSERNTEENFVEFDPLGTIQKSVEIAKIEMTLLDDYFSQAKTEAEKANYRGMMDNSVAILTDPKSPTRYNLLKRSQKNTVNLIRLPQNFEERLERIGMYHSEGGMSMILMPTTAADEMVRAFPGVTKKNVNSEIAHVVMAAQSLSSSQVQRTQTPSYFFEEVNKDTDAEFKSIGKLNQSTKKREGWRLAKQGMTRAQVADAFANEFENRIAKWLEDTRNRFSNGRKKTISMDGRITKAAMFQAKSLIRQIVLAYSSGKLEGNRYISVNSEVEKFMSMIDDIDADTMGENGMPRSFTFKMEDAGKLITESMQLFKIEKTFSLVFSALEADLIAKRMVSGMTVSDSNTDLTMMRLAHHHDGRIRSRFRKSLSAKQAVRHLVGILDHGFDGVSGREGYETSRRIAKEEIGEAARKVGSSAKNHAIGYLLAQIRGIKDAHGMSLAHAYTTWATQQNFGHLQSQNFVTAQEKKYGKNKVSKYWSGGHLDLVRDQPLATEIDSIMRKATSVISIKSNDPLAEQKAEKAIADLEAALINAIEDNKNSEVDDYAKTLSSIFSDIDAAMHFSLALSSKKGRDVDALDEKTKWKHADIQAFKPTATNVPMRLGYAKDPIARKQGREGRYVSDPIEIVAMDEAAFFGGIAKGEPFERNRVYRPVMVNGLSTPLSIIDDAIYRLNITPSYEILRHSIGKVRAPHGPIEITDSDMEDTLRSFNENSDQFETIREANFRNNERYRWMKDANTAFAAVAYELETILQNDSAIGTARTGGAETIRFLSAMYIMRALASPLQWWDQSVSPSFGYTVGKLVANKPKSVELYFSTLSKMLTSRKFRNQIKNFIQETSPYVYYRASDGQDVAEDMIRGQERYGVGQVKAKIGRGFRVYERFAEKALSFTIGAPERMLAGTIYMVELAEKMKAETIQDVLLRKNEITKELAQQAKLKVNDVMAQSDQSKKSWFFQTRDQNPVLNAFWRSLGRFSNHTSSMSSNTAVLTQTMFTDQEKGMSEMDDYYVSQKDAEESRREAMENIATTLTQNILFYPMKLEMLLPAVLYLIFKAGDDDDDEAALRAQRVTNEMIAPDENSNIIHRIIMGLIFGKDRPLFQDRGTVDEAQASAFAEMINYTSQEMLTTIPIAGVAFGYSPVRGLIDKAFTNPGSEEAAALLMDVERDSVNIRQYRPGFIEGAAEFTAPTGTVYDYAAATKLLLDYNMTSQASNNRAVSLRDSLFYLISEAFPGAREARSFMQDKLREPVNNEKR